KAQYNLGVVLAATGRPVEARQALTEAHRLDPNDAQTRECLRLLGETPTNAPSVPDRP
ncbi:MAG: tetratricopeptide repeat protein, partial [Phycisphaerales bacterium]|nr:tetratricopeptide repeat protein [Phycisphaerales bacterium]